MHAFHFVAYVKMDGSRTESQLSCAFFGGHHRKAVLVPCTILLVRSTLHITMAVVSNGKKRRPQNPPFSFDRHGRRKGHISSLLQALSLFL